MTIKVKGIYIISYPEFFLNVIDAEVGVNLEDLEGVEIPVGVSRPQKPVNLLLGGQGGILGFHLISNEET